MYRSASVYFGPKVLSLALTITYQPVVRYGWGRVSQWTERQVYTSTSEVRALGPKETDRRTALPCHTLTPLAVVGADVGVVGETFTVVAPT